MRLQQHGLTEARIRDILRKATNSKDILHMSKRSLDTGGVLAAIFLGLIAGPTLFYALAGDFFHVLTINWPYARITAGAIGTVATIGGLVNAERFRQPGLTGALTGLAGAIGQVVVVALPWYGYYLHHRSCSDSSLCPLPSTADLLQLILVVGGFGVVVFTLAGYSLASLLSTLRRRYV